MIANDDIFLGYRASNIMCAAARRWAEGTKEGQKVRTAYAWEEHGPTVHALAVTRLIGVVGPRQRGPEEDGWEWKK